LITYIVKSTKKQKGKSGEMDLLLLKITISQQLKGLKNLSFIAAIGTTIAL